MQMARRRCGSRKTLQRDRPRSMGMQGRHPLPAHSKPWCAPSNASEVTMRKKPCSPHGWPHELRTIQKGTVWMEGWGGRGTAGYKPAERCISRGGCTHAMPIRRSNKFHTKAHRRPPRPSPPPRRCGWSGPRGCTRCRYRLQGGDDKMKPRRQEVEKGAGMDGVTEFPHRKMQRTVHRMPHQCTCRGRQWRQLCS